MISKAVKTTLKHQYSWVKTEFWLLLGVIFGSALLCRIFPVPDWLGVIAMVILFFSAVMFMTENALRNNTGSAFSWKFIMGLPLSKKEVLLLILLSGLFLTLPLFCLLFSYWSFLRKSIFDNVHSLPLIASNMFLCFSFIYIFSTHNLIVLPRKEFQKKNATNNLVKFLKSLSVFLCVIFYSLVFAEYVEVNYSLDISTAFIKLIDFIGTVISGWWVVPLWIVVIIFFYKKTLKIWNNEKLSYKPVTWNPKKEYSILITSTLLFSIGVYNTDFKTASRYRGDIQKLVYKKDYKALEAQLNSKNINEKNQLDFTPMFVAIREGNVEMVKFLESKGATFDGIIISKINYEKGYDAFLLAIDSGKTEMLDYMISKKGDVNSIRPSVGYTPIHFAALNCRSEMVDHLIKAGAEINIVNDKGETPLMVASKMNCFSVAVSLKEAGADFNLKNKKAQTALDLTKVDNRKYSKEFKYFLEKNMRVPASK